MKLPRNVDLGLLLLRLIIGVVFMFHGSQKLFGAFEGSGIDGFAGYLGSLGLPAPELQAYAAAGAEFFGGLAVLLGLFTRLAAIPLTITMLVASFVAHAGKFSAQAGGMEYSLTLAVVCAALIAAGAGRYSLDNRLFARAKNS